MRLSPHSPHSTSQLVSQTLLLETSQIRSLPLLQPLPWTICPPLAAAVASCLVCTPPPCCVLPLEILPILLEPLTDRWLSGKLPSALGVTPQEQEIRGISTDREGMMLGHQNPRSSQPAIPDHQASSTAKRHSEGQPRSWQESFLVAVALAGALEKPKSLLISRGSGLSQAGFERWLYHFPGGTHPRLCQGYRDDLETDHVV